MREIRYLDKLVDELAKGKPMEKSCGRRDAPGLDLHADRSSRSSTVGILSSVTLAKAMRMNRSWPPRTCRRDGEKILLVGHALRHLGRWRAGEGMLHIGEVGADADEAPAVGAFQPLAQQVGARLQTCRVVPCPRQQVAQSVKRALLGEAGRTDRDAVHGLLDLGHQFRSSGDGADTIARQREDLGETVEMDQRAAPIRPPEEIVRPRALGKEILVGLVEQQARFRASWRVEEGVDRLRRIDAPADCWARSGRIARVRGPISFSASSRARHGA